MVASFLFVNLCHIPPVNDGQGEGDEDHAKNNSDSDNGTVWDNFLRLASRFQLRYKSSVRREYGPVAERKGHRCHCDPGFAQQGLKGTEVLICVLEVCRAKMYDSSLRGEGIARRVEVLQAPPE